jgi:type II restriction enzyme
MDLFFETELADKYSSQSQKIRVLTEHWVDNQVYCPNCGHSGVDKYGNNKPVADFFCSNCREDYELKSKKGTMSTKIVDGAYRTMIERLEERHNPNLFMLNYDAGSLQVLNFLVIPKHFFVPDIIEMRKPLSPTARRAGWVGCNILLQTIPTSGKIFFVKNKIVEPKAQVLAKWKKTLFLREEQETSTKGWLLDVMSCIEKLGRKDFSLHEVYAFEDILSKKHPDNRHIRDKIRQQLQFLRDRGYLEFVERGRYRLT